MSVEPAKSTFNSYETFKLALKSVDLEYSAFIHSVCQESVFKSVKLIKSAFNFSEINQVSMHVS